MKLRPCWQCEHRHRAAGEHPDPGRCARSARGRQLGGAAAAVGRQLGGAAAAVGAQPDLGPASGGGDGDRPAALLGEPAVHSGASLSTVLGSVSSSGGRGGSTPQECAACRVSPSERNGNCKSYVLDKP